MIAKARTHIKIPVIIIYFFHPTFSFKINLEAKIVTTIELVLITETAETLPSSNATLFNIEDEESNTD